MLISLPTNHAKVAAIGMFCFLFANWTTGGWTSGTIGWDIVCTIDWVTLEVIIDGITIALGEVHCVGGVLDPSKFNLDTRLLGVWSISLFNSLSITYAASLATLAALVL